MIVELRKRNARYKDLTPRQPYVVIGIEGDDFRILSDSGQPYLDPPACSERSISANRAIGLPNSAKAGSDTLIRGL